MLLHFVGLGNFVFKVLTEQYTKISRPFSPISIYVSFANPNRKGFEQPTIFALAPKAPTWPPSRGRLLWTNLSTQMRCMHHDSAVDSAIHATGALTNIFKVFSISDPFLTPNFCAVTVTVTPKRPTRDQDGCGCRLPY